MQNKAIYISDIHNGDYIKVREVDFGDQLPKSFVVSVASALRGGRIEVRADSIGGTLMAEIAVPHTGGWGMLEGYEDYCENSGERYT